MKSAYNRAPQQQQQNPKFSSKNHQVCIPIKLNLIIQLTNSKIAKLLAKLNLISQPIRN